MPTVIIDRDAAHEAAQRELAKPIYPKAGVSDRINDWIDELIYKIFMGGAQVPGGWFTITVLVTLVVVAIVVAIRIASRTMRTNRSGDFELFDSTELSAAEHRATAERFAAEGDWAAAIRHRLRAVARQLEENGVLNAVPGRTANELARDAGQALPELAADLATAAVAFNDVTYGELPGSPQTYQNIAALDERIRSGRATASSQAAADGDPESWAQLQ
jgi:uncharacterized membrane protein